jgi:hypothetical protein
MSQPRDSSHGPDAANQEGAAVSDGVVRTPWYCMKCGYLLVGLPSNGRCPECATEVALSLREPGLANASPEYLASLRKGLSLVLNGILLMVASTAGFVLASILVSTALGIVDLVHTGIGLGVSAMLYVGYWHLTAPDPAQVANERASTARNVVRVAVLVMAALGVVQLMLQVVSPTMGVVVSPLGLLLMGALGLVGVVAWAVQYFAMMRYVRWLAGRVPDAFIVARTKRYMWLLPVLTTVGVLLLGIGPLIALVLYWNLLNRLRKHVKSILEKGTPAALPKM